MSAHEPQDSGGGFAGDDPARRKPARRDQQSPFEPRYFKPRAAARLDLERLLVAFGNRELEGRGLARLRALAASGADRIRFGFDNCRRARSEPRADQLREEPLTDRLERIQELHRAFDAERMLRTAILTPTQPSEEADPAFRSLQRVAGRAETELRARLAAAPPQPMVVGAKGTRPITRTRRVLAWSLVAAAAGLLAAFVVVRFAG